MSPSSALKDSLLAKEDARLEQRLHRRYPISLDVQYKLRNKGEGKASGSGRTFNISSGGVFFHTGDALPTGGEIEVLMQWPFLLDGNCPLKLVVLGKIVRSDSDGTAIRAFRHEFRTSKRPDA